MSGEAAEGAVAGPPRLAGGGARRRLRGGRAGTYQEHQHERVVIHAPADHQGAGEADGLLLSERLLPVLQQESDSRGPRLASADFCEGLHEALP